MITRTDLLNAVRSLRKEHGPGNVRLLRRIRRENGVIKSVFRPIEDSIQEGIEGEKYLLWNNRSGSTKAVRLD